MPITTAEMADSLTFGKREDLNHAIPCALPLQAAETDLPIDPYLFGLWLGDGTAREPIVTCHPADEPHYRAAAERASHPWRASVDRNGNLNALDGGRTAGRIEVRHPSARAGASTATSTSRKRTCARPFASGLELLRGLMDADGYARKQGSECEIALSDGKLADDARELIVSLGHRTSRSVKSTSHKDSHRIRFRPLMDVFSLPRKAQRIKAPGAQASRFRARMVAAVTPEGEAQATCIAVGQPVAPVPGRTRHDTDTQHLGGCRAARA